MKFARHCSTGSQKLADTLDNQAKNQPGMEMVQMLGGNQLLLSLGKSPNLAPIFERVTLEDICFDEQFIIIQFTPKSDLL